MDGSGLGTAAQSSSPACQLDGTINSESESDFGHLAFGKGTVRTGAVAGSTTRSHAERDAEEGVERVQNDTSENTSDDPGNTHELSSLAIIEEDPSRTTQAPVSVFGSEHVSGPILDSQCNAMHDAGARLDPSEGEHTARSRELTSSASGQSLLRWLGMGGQTMSAMAAAKLKNLAQCHLEHVKLRGKHRRKAGAAAVGNWTREHPLLTRNSAGTVLESSIGLPETLELLD